MGMSHQHPDIERILLTAEQIRPKVAELSAAISGDYQDRDLTLVCVLRGAVVFLGDLLRELPDTACVDFMAIGSYGAGTHSTGVVRILKDLEDSVESRNVLVIEDIVDTGLTL